MGLPRCNRRCSGALTTSRGGWSGLNRARWALRCRQLDIGDGIGPRSASPAFGHTTVRPGATHPAKFVARPAHMAASGAFDFCAVVSSPFHFAPFHAHTAHAAKPIFRMIITPAETANHGPRLLLDT